MAIQYLYARSLSSRDALKNRGHRKVALIFVGGARYAATSSEHYADLEDGLRPSQVDFAPALT